MGVQTMKFRDQLAESIWGVKRTDSMNCVCHNQPQSREKFETEVCWREFGISGLCQSEQNRLFHVLDKD